MPDNDDHSQDVGYAKPPAHTRFQKGVSGNPRGRPKGARNLATVLERTLKERVVINENGIRKTVTKLEAAIKQLANKAASGDLLAMRLLTALAGSAEVGTAAAPSKSDLSDADQKVMARFLERLEKPEKGDDNGNDH
jgi:Family of unknown function (DUF5681)